MDRGACALLILLASVPPAAAQPPSTGSGQGFPTKPIRLIVGPGSDLVARLVGSRLTPMWGQQIVVDARPGAGGAIALETVAKANPDGYTWLLSTAVYTIHAALYEKPAADLGRDFAPVTNLASASFFLLVHPSVPAKSVHELIELARAKPGQLNYASAGVGTPPHLAAEMFKSMAKIGIVHVPYKSVAIGMTDLLAGQVQLTFQFAPTVLPHMKAGRLRALGVSSLRRYVLAPDVPTLSESGLAGFEVIGWNGVHVPKGTPAAVVAKMNADIRQVLKLPDVQERLLASGLDEAGAPVEDFAAFVKRDIARFSKVIKEAGIRPE
ncbi:MAG TPA: tripartite tricarboxylate transporter substrate binding protein [Burkholderiales bacterium]|nr:tripartite tricarboxylate transporter substrate binding protein [Burkholderiales bacterium]